MREADVSYSLNSVDSLRPPAIEETTQTAGRKSSKKKTPKKGVKGEDDDETATDGTAPSSPLNGNDIDEIKKEDNMLEHGVAPLPEGVNAEGQAVVKIEPNGDAKGKGRGKAKANGKSTTATTPKKKAATPRKRKVKDAASGDENGENMAANGDEAESKPVKKARTRTTSTKKAEDQAIAAVAESDVAAVGPVKMEE